MTTRRILRSLLLLVALTTTVAVAFALLPRQWLNREAPPDPGAVDQALVHAALNRLDLASLEPRDEEPIDRILLITLDTTRADHFSCYGYPLPTTPFLDELAAHGVLFQRAYATMATTAPAHASILTGLYPLEHRVEANGQALPGEIYTLPEALEEAGFVTAAVVATRRHFGVANFGQGFQTFLEPTKEEEPTAEFSVDGSTVLRYRPAELTLNAAAHWLENNLHQPRIFLWVHLFDPHFPQQAHPQELEDLGLGSDGSAPDSWWQFNEPGFSWDLTKPANHRRIQRYDSELRYVDGQLRSFFEQFQDHLDGFLVAVTADHGEGLGNHSWWGHARLSYEEAIRIPLILRWPDFRYRGVEDAVVEHTDIMPTLLLAAGIEGSDLAERRRLPIEGQPLQWHLDRHPDSRFHYAFAQRRTYLPRSLPSLIKHRLHNLRSPVGNFEEGERYTLTGTNTKFQWQTLLGDELYDLAQDPLERQNLVTQRPDEARRLRATAAAILHELRTSANLDTHILDQETQDALRELGYVQ